MSETKIPSQQEMEEACQIIYPDSTRGEVRRCVGDMKRMYKDIEKRATE